MTAEPEYSASLSLSWRPMAETDRAFVLASWLRSYALSPEMRGLAHPVYYELYTPVVQRLVDAGEVSIAHDAELPDVVVGFVVREPRSRVLHYVFTKRSFRQNGVAKWMLKDLPNDTVYSPQPWHFGVKLVRSGWTRDAMSRWTRRTSA